MSSENIVRCSKKCSKSTVTVVEHAPAEPPSPESDEADEADDCVDSVESADSGTHMPDNQPKRETFFVIKLNQVDLTHLRDLFSIHLPDMRDTVSSKLAKLSGRDFNEPLLWRKIADACVRANVPLEDEAPDFVITPEGPPPLGVFQIATTNDQIYNDEGE